MLSRELAHAGHYPAIDVLASVSRLIGEVVTRETRMAGDEVRTPLAAYRDKEDLIAIGAYQPGTDPLTDAAIAARNPIEGFLKQLVDEPTSAEEADMGLSGLASLGRADDLPVTVMPDEPLIPASSLPSEPGGTPLHSAIPPLNLAA